MHCINDISASLPFTAYLSSQNNSFFSPAACKKLFQPQQMRPETTNIVLTLGENGSLVTEMIYKMIRTPV